jgi:hypothetical protein
VKLEEKQRERRKIRPDWDYKGTWFYLGKHRETQEEVWLSNNKYWLRDYSKCPELY